MGNGFWISSAPLSDLFHWSLHDIDLTDIESLIPFAFRYPAWKERNPKRATVRRM